MSSSSNQATTVFVLGLLSIVLCPILGPFAWQQGNNYQNWCLLEGEEPDGLATAGRIMGIIGTVQLALGGMFFLLACCAGALGN